MLFDLRGRRRRAVQGTYLLLAILMGGGLVLFGVGSNVSGGLFDIFGNGGGGGNGNSQLEQRIERNEKRLAASPRDEVALKALARDHYALAVSNQSQGATSFPEESRDDLRAAARYWQRYLAVVKGEPDPSLASVALQVYDVGGLNRTKEAEQAMRIIAERQNNYQAYVALVQRASVAGDTRTADLAAQKAVDLAPESLKMQVKKAADRAKKTGTQMQSSTTPQQ